MVKICVCGAFRLGETPKGGQEIKTCIVANTLEKFYRNVYRIDTLAPNSRLKMPFQLLWALFKCSDIVILPAQNGLVVLSKLLTWLNNVFHRQLHYCVIGGWLQDLLADMPDVKGALSLFIGVYVETQTMKDALHKLGLNNVSVVPNFKPLKIIRPSELPMSFEEPYKLVTFSRVTKNKGIGDAVELVIKLNKKYKRRVYTLDIYGPVDEGEDFIWFEEQKKHFSNEINYKGVIPFAESVEILKDYFALLFPTRYFTEGIPGTIIDSYAAGLPVISSRWKSFNDVVIDGVTGLGYDFGDNQKMEQILDAIIAHPSIVINLKRNCVEMAKVFLPDNAIKPICTNIDNRV